MASIGCWCVCFSVPISIARTTGFWLGPLVAFCSIQEGNGLLTQTLTSSYQFFAWVTGHDWWSNIIGTSGFWLGAMVAFCSNQECNGLLTPFCSIQEGNGLLAQTLTSSYQFFACVTGHVWWSNSWRMRIGYHIYKVTYYYLWIHSIFWTYLLSYENELGLSEPVTRLHSSNMTPRRSQCPLSHFWVALDSVCLYLILCS